MRCAAVSGKQLESRSRPLSNADGAEGGERRIPQRFALQRCLKRGYRTVVVLVSVEGASVQAPDETPPTRIATLRCGTAFAPYRDIRIERALMPLSGRSCSVAVSFRRSRLDFSVQWNTFTLRKPRPRWLVPIPILLGRATASCHHSVVLSKQDASELALRPPRWRFLLSERFRLRCSVT